EIAEAELGRLVGAAPGTAIEPAAAFDVPPPANTAIDALLESARGKRPERAALLKRVQAARDRRAAAAVGDKPTIAVAGGGAYARPNPRIFPREDVWQSSRAAGVRVSWT